MSTVLYPAIGTAITALELLVGAGEWRHPAAGLPLLLIPALVLPPVSGVGARRYPTG